MLDHMIKRLFSYRPISTSLSISVLGLISTFKRLLSKHSVSLFVWILTSLL